MDENSRESQMALYATSKELDLASIMVNKEGRPQTVFRIVLDLSKEVSQYQPYKIAFPFKSLAVQSVDDPKAFVHIKTITNDEQQDYFTIKSNDTFKVSEAIPQAYLHWPAQIGKMTIVVFTDAEFSSGTMVSLNSGGVSINDGASVSNPVSVTLVAGTAGIIAPQDLTRKVATIQNKSGNDIFIGGPTVTNAGVTEGIAIPNGQMIQYRNTGALYAYSVGGGKVTRIEES